MKGNVLSRASVMIFCFCSVLPMYFSISPSLLIRFHAISSTDKVHWCRGPPTLRVGVVRIFNVSVFSNVTSTKGSFLSARRICPRSLIFCFSINSDIFLILCVCSVFFSLSLSFSSFAFSKTFSLVQLLSRKVGGIFIFFWCPSFGRHLFSQQGYWWIVGFQDHMLIW